MNIDEEGKCKKIRKFRIVSDVRCYPSRVTPSEYFKHTPSSTKMTKKIKRYNYNSENDTIITAVLTLFLGIQNPAYERWVYVWVA